MIQIVIHILPQEIDQLEQSLIRLKYNANHLEYKILVDVVLNLNLIDWSNSIIPKSFFINKFNQLEQLTKTWADTKFEINEDGSIQGCVSHRRKSFKETKADAVLLLDTDIFFSNTLLYYVTTSVEALKNKSPYYILTPQTTPLWDNSWDSIASEKFIDNKIHFQSRDPYKSINHYPDDVSVLPINEFKIGGGLATVLSAPLVKKITIPESLGHYGLEDTYIMFCSNIMRQKGINVNQYIIKNEVVTEDHLFKFNPYKDYLTIIDKQEEFKKISHENFQKEIIKFGNTVNI